MTNEERLNLDDIGVLITTAKQLAKQYRRLTGRPLGCTGEVAEYEAARLLGLELAAVRQPGYDAIRCKSNRLERLQIKGRCILSDKPGQRLGRIDLRKEWDGVLLVLLDVSGVTEFDSTAPLLRSRARVRSQFDTGEPAHFSL